MGDTYREFRKHRHQERTRRRKLAAESWPKIQAYAEKNGLVVEVKERIGLDEIKHLTVEPADRRWRLHVYPGNRRLYNDPYGPTPAPYLKRVIPEYWTILDVLKAIAKMERKHENRVD